MTGRALVGCGGGWREVAAAVARRLDGDGPALLLGADFDGTVAETTAAVVATSGSSGYPKRVILSEAALRASAAATEEALGGRGQWLLCLPAFYVAGLQVLVRSHLTGLPPAVVEDAPFTAEAFAAAADTMTERRRYASVVPAQLLTLVDAGEASERIRGSVARLDALLTGGQAVPAGLVARAQALGYTVVRSYGSSETATGCVYDGYPLANVKLRLIDGQLEITGPMLADGYLGDPQLTARAFVTADGIRWYRTGDRAAIAADGRVDVLGRADNVIISGGINVSLDRVEAIVRELLPDAVVVAGAHERWGCVPVVVTATVPTPNAQTPNAQAPDALAGLRARLRQEIGPAAQPDRIVVLESLPMLASGKPDRRAIAQLV